MFDLDDNMDLSGLNISEGDNLSLNKLALWMKGCMSAIANSAKTDDNGDFEIKIKYDPDDKLIKLSAYTGGTFPLLCRWDADNIVELATFVDEEPEGNAEWSEWEIKGA